MEKVNTGGIISFQYSRGYKPKLTKGEELEIDEAYKKYDERKKRERKKRIIIIGSIIFILIICGIIAKFFYS